MILVGGGREYTKWVVEIRRANVCIERDLVLTGQIDLIDQE